MSAVINSRVCPTSEEGGLAFVFSYADDFVEPASIEWDEFVHEMNGAGLLNAIKVLTLSAMVPEGSLTSWYW